MDQSDYMNQMMNDNTNVLNDEKTVHTDSWQFDADKGLMLSTVSVTHDKVVELTPLAVKQIIHSWNQAVLQGDTFRRMYNLIDGSSIQPDKKEAEILSQWKQVIANADKAKEYIEKNDAHITAMNKWTEDQADKEKESREAIPVSKVAEPAPEVKAVEESKD